MLARKGAPFPEDNLIARKELVELPANLIDEKDKIIIIYF